MGTAFWLSTGKVVINPGPGSSEALSKDRWTLRSTRICQSVGKRGLLLKGFPKLGGGDVGDALSVFQLNSVSKVL